MTLEATLERIATALEKIANTPAALTPVAAQPETTTDVSSPEAKATAPAKGSRKRTAPAAEAASPAAGVADGSDPVHAELPGAPAPDPAPAPAAEQSVAPSKEAVDPAGGAEAEITYPELQQKLREFALKNGRQAVIDAFACLGIKDLPSLAKGLYPRAMGIFTGAEVL